MSAPARQGQRLTKNEDSIVKIFTNNGRKFIRDSLHDSVLMSPYVITNTSMSIDSRSPSVVY